MFPVDHFVYLTTKPPPQNHDPPSNPLLSPHHTSPRPKNTGSQTLTSSNSSPSAANTKTSPALSQTSTPFTNHPTTSPPHKTVLSAGSSKKPTRYGTNMSPLKKSGKS